MDPEFTAIYLAEDNTDAKLACGYLQSQGFQVYCLNSVNPLGNRYYSGHDLQVMVPTDEAEEARESLKACSPDRIIPRDAIQEKQQAPDLPRKQVEETATTPVREEYSDEQCPKCASNRVTSRRKSGYYKFIANLTLICWVGFFGMIGIFHLSNINLVISWLAGLLLLHLFKRRIQRKKTCLNCKSNW